MSKSFLNKVFLTKKRIILAFLFLLLFSILTFFAGIFIVSKYIDNLPEHEKLKSYVPNITTRLYTSDGALLDEFSIEKRVFVPFHMIPKNLINAFLAAEDANFYKHPGIDTAAIIKATLRNSLSFMSGDNKRYRGASTITQQVVKNMLLSRERTISRKIKEAILAFKITKILPKDKILELYLNQIYLGSSSYGVAAAAQEYFNKSIDELTIEENALLATLPKAPSKLDPRKNIKKAKARRDWVINRMVEEDFITSDQGEEAKSRPIILNNRKENERVPASFFIDSVKAQLIDLYGSEYVFEEGMIVNTTLDSDLQRIAVKTLQEGIEDYDKSHGYRGPIGKLKIKNINDWKEEFKDFKYKEIYNINWDFAVIIKINSDHVAIGLKDGKTGIIKLSDVKWARKYINVNSIGPSINKVSDVFSLGDIIFVERKEDKSNLYSLKQLPKVNGALVAMDPHNGKVLAMVGGYVNQPNQFNRATQAYRQPGSTLKTFAYIAALENGMNPATIIMDEEILLDQGSGKAPYRPNNYTKGFYGPTTLRQGLEKSINVTTVRMADQVGMNKVVAVMKKFGIADDNVKPYYSIVLGSLETSLIKLTNAYSMMVNGGKKITPSLIEKVHDRYGNTIFKRDQRECKKCQIEPNKDGIVADNMIGNLPFPILSDDKEYVTDSATAYQIVSMLQGAVENGTAIRAKEIGKIIGGKTGTTNSSNDSWFVGFSSDLVVGVYVGFDRPQSLGRRETGSTLALPIFINFMKSALANKSSTPFKVPNSIKFVKIDKKTGKIPSEFSSGNIIFEAFKIDDNMDNVYDNFDNILTDGEVGDETNEGGVVEQQKNQDIPFNGIY